MLGILQSRRQLSCTSLDTFNINFALGLHVSKFILTFFEGCDVKSNLVVNVSSCAAPATIIIII